MQFDVRGVLARGVARVSMLACVCEEIARNIYRVRTGESVFLSTYHVIVKERSLKKYTRVNIECATTYGGSV